MVRDAKYQARRTRTQAGVHECTAHVQFTVDTIQRSGVNKKLGPSTFKLHQVEDYKNNILYSSRKGFV